MKKLFYAALLISVLFGDESFELNATNPIKIDIISLTQNKVNLKNIIPQSTPNELAALTLYSQKEAINEHNIILASGKDFVALIDTGYEKTIDELKTALNERALTPEQITHVIITHSHQDHIGGVKALPNAQILVNEKELGFWQEKSSTEGLNIKTFAPNTELINGSGIYAIAAYGHTPGHSVIAFGASGTSEAELFASTQFLFVADIFHAYELQAAAPEVAFVWDHNKADAIKARKKVINALKAHKTSFIGTHMPYSKRVKIDEN
ncbi:MBL fold metallo-hydrolase [Campylobacter sp.]|uniref:MBL fold metallo-hydrolase n=1 Tax=Campylobacter sp. TaxID=205 RepID=UPI002AA8D528|nr:MBL fold metallo-hydrolase [Campylobacter sp.]MCI7236861.1 MBL fold metallo-hydrolase [Campylobacter sp.]